MRRAQAAGSVLGMGDDSNAAKRSQRGERTDKSDKSASSPRRRSSLEDPVQRAIGEKLRAVFDEVVQQPVPERFAELLRKLAEQEQKNK